MARLAVLCLALLATSLQATQPVNKEKPAKALRAETKAEVPVKKVEAVTPAPQPKIAFRTSADGVTRPLGADIGSLVKLSDDGFTLKVEKKGDDARFPKRGDMVTVHYVGMLKDGTVFDSSRARKEAFSFPIGRGRVIRGWDQGVITMSLGERAVLHLPSYKAYGSSGAPPAIPPNAELDFDVELLAINGEAAPGFEFPKQPVKSGSSGMPALLVSTLIMLAARMML